MTDKEKFQNTFVRMHASPDMLLEVMKMTADNDNNVVNIKRKRKPRTIVVAACLLLVLVIGTSSMAYAADIGGIQRTVQLWLHGDQTDVTMTIDSGSYSMEYKDADGNTRYQGGGGVAFNSDGSERPLTEEELMEEINAPDVSYEDDGSVWVYYFDQKIDITDKFKDGVCYMQLEYGDETLYLTVKYQNGCAYSPKKYISPYEFN